MDSPRSLGVPDSFGLVGPARRRWSALVAGMALAMAAWLLALAPSGAQTSTVEIPASLETAVRTQAATATGTQASAVQFIRAERVVWNDGCLGVQEQNEQCTQALVSGYVVWVNAGDQFHRFHTDYTGQSIRTGQSPITGATEATIQAEEIPQGATAFEANLDALPDALETAIREAAATRAGGGVTADQINILRVEEVFWEDACVGVQQSGVACAEVITPGFVVWLSAGTNVYRYHTGEQASNIQFAEQGLDEANVPAYELPEGTTEEPMPTELLTGQVPTSGFALLIVNANATPAEIVTALVAAECSPVSIAVTEEGEFVTYIPGAPTFVNAGFPTSVAGGTGFAVRCA